MATNTFLYPPNFNDGNDAGAVISTFDTAIAVVQIQSRDTALKQSYKSRTAAQDTIAVLGKISPQSYFRLPLHKIGRKILTGSSLLGRVGYFAGGRVEYPQRAIYSQISIFRYSNEALTLSNATLSDKRCYGSSCGNDTTGVACGGNNGIVVVQSIDKIDYLKESVVRTNGSLDLSVGCAPGGIGTKTRGLMIGQGSTVSYTHSTDTISILNTFASYEGYSVHQGISSKDAGYNWTRLGWDGVSDWNWNAPTNAVSKVLYANNAFTPSQLSITPPHHHINRAAASSASNGYIIAGSNTVPAYTNWFSNDITRFNFSSETAALMTDKLSRNLTCLTAVGSSLAGYTGGGDAPPVGSNWFPGSRIMEKLHYLTEATSVIGAELSYPSADHVTFTDFNPSWSQ